MAAVKPIPKEFGREEETHQVHTRAVLIRSSATGGRLAVNRNRNRIAVLPSNLGRSSRINVVCPSWLRYLGQETIDRWEDWPQGETTPGSFAIMRISATEEMLFANRMPPRPHPGSSRSSRSHPSIHRMLLDDCLDGLIEEISEIFCAINKNLRKIVLFTFKLTFLI
ncbi:uncharacterized protein LOC119765639 isoform X1 [Culex quinquefasciatus]|uniref:uncharacterized protein LOC119765639 isoform X1 n=1 Tax=Culex quinquefasciatus TaxID=7176 RepID=UPI0018E31686|nr:uncharacterized protein LOC119765639 isoform X1 [Culex quinquefasciatus]